MTDIIDADEIVSFTDAPSESESETLTRLGRELYDTDAKLAAAKAEVERLAEQRKVLTMKELPDYMLRIKQDKIGLSEFDVDLVLEDYCHANIASDWEPEKKGAAFDWLEESGNGDLIKCVFTIAFPRYMLKLAYWLRDAIAAIVPPTEDFPDARIPEPSIEKTVTWNTLTAFCKEQIKNGEALPLDVLGCTIGKVVKIKERKPTKGKKK